MASGRVTAITSRAVVCIVAYFPVIAIHFSPVAVFMAGDTGENLIVVRIVVALGAICPLTAMFARIDREPLLVVLLVEV